jgi:hypothetical protein
VEIFIPIVGMILVLGPVATWAVSITPIGRALADRLRGGAAGSDDRLHEMQDEIERLQDHVLGQDQRLEELQDRLDFTERLLARKSSVPEEADPI